MHFFDRYTVLRKSDPGSSSYRQRSYRVIAEEENGNVKNKVNENSYRRLSFSNKYSSFSYRFHVWHRKEATASWTDGVHSIQKGVAYEKKPLSSTSSGGSNSNKITNLLQKGFTIRRFSLGSKRNSVFQPIKLTGNGPIPINIRDTMLRNNVLHQKRRRFQQRVRPLLPLDHFTHFTKVHSSLATNKNPYCIKILSTVRTNQNRRSSIDAFVGSTCRLSIDSTDNQEYNNQNTVFTRNSSFSEKEIKVHKEKQNSIKLTGYMFACSTHAEREEIVSRLTRVARPNLQEERRLSISLHTWIQEAKNVPTKKRYFCELQLDGQTYARTTTKLYSDMLFWGEEFLLNDLEPIETVSILMWRVMDEGSSSRKKKSNSLTSTTPRYGTLVCQVDIPTRDITVQLTPGCTFDGSATSGTGIIDINSTAFDKWYTSTSASTMSGNSGGGGGGRNNISNTTTNSNSPTVRIRSQYTQLLVLPLTCYQLLLDLIVGPQGVPLMLKLETWLKVKQKEQLAQSLVRIVQHQGVAATFIADLVYHEVNQSHDNNLLLRGNSLASKTLEVYMRLVGEKYLQLVLGDFVELVVTGDEDCEVDPQRLKGTAGRSPASLELKHHRESLQMHVEMVWAKVMSSSVYFPRDMRLLFTELRKRLTSTPQTKDGAASKVPAAAATATDDPLSQYACQRVLAASLFLRLICPAILAPSLFHLLPQYPSCERVVRVFTLVAKALQTLANYSGEPPPTTESDNHSQHQPPPLLTCKEPYMAFLTPFLQDNLGAMRDFLCDISQPATVTGGSISQQNTSHLNNSDGKGNNNDVSDYFFWENLSNGLSRDSIDLAQSLATLHLQLSTLVASIDPTQITEAIIDKLRIILAQVTSKSGLADIPETGKPVADQIIKLSSKDEDNSKWRRRQQQEVELAWREMLHLAASAESNGKRKNKTRATDTGTSTDTNSTTSAYQSLSRSQDSLLVQNINQSGVSSSVSQSAISGESAKLSQTNMSNVSQYCANNQSYLATNTNGTFNNAKFQQSAASVKRCKQTRRLSTELCGNSTPAASRKPLYRNTVAIDTTPSNLKSYRNLSGSTSTLTGPQTVSVQSQQIGYCTLSSSMSLPSISDQTNTKPIEDRKHSAFSSVNQSHTPIQWKDKNVYPHTSSYSEVKSCSQRLQDRLGKLNLDLTLRTRQLILSDRTTILLELERIRLLRQAFALPSVMASSILGSGCCQDEWDIFRYLNQAEGVLTEVQHLQANCDSGDIVLSRRSSETSAEPNQPVSPPPQDRLNQLESVLAAILETNQQLQARLVPRDRRPEPSISEVTTGVLSRSTVAATPMYTRGTLLTSGGGFRQLQQPRAPPRTTSTNQQAPGQGQSQQQQQQAQQQQQRYHSTKTEIIDVV